MTYYGARSTVVVVSNSTEVVVMCRSDVSVQTCNAVHSALAEAARDDAVFDHRVMLLTGVLIVFATLVASVAAFRVAW